jgi:hypothetical protein
MDRLRRQLSAAALGLGTAVWGGVAACAGDGAPARAQAAGVVDTILPREEALARFRAGLPEVTSLSGGAPSRDALIRRFVDALARADTVAFGDLRLTRTEFAWLYYPTNPQGLPPYSLPPGLMWDMLALDSDKGLRRALSEFAARPLSLAGFACDAGVSQQGDNVVAGPCTVRLAVGGDAVAQRLFGLLIERGGVHKFVSYANKL